MTDYRITLRLKAPLGSKLQSDTLFGHFCWQVAYGRWTGGDIDEFLEPFLKGEPPLVLSDGFPPGVLAKPLCWRFDIRDDTISLEANDRAKKRGKARYVTEADFHRIRRGEEPQDKPISRAFEEVETLHASIDRLTGTTPGEGGLFQTTELVPVLNDEPDDRMVIYARCKQGWEDTLESLFIELSKSGYGRDKSVGLGAFKVEHFEPYAGFEMPQGANGFVSLSSYVPAPADPSNGFYRLRTKYGKLSEIVPSGNPWKRPLLQIEPGACFYTAKEPQPYYGRLVTNIAPGDARAVQCGFTMAVGIIMQDQSR